MNFKKIAAALAMTGATVFSGAAFADPSITNLDGTNSPFGGFDWASAAAAWTNDFVPNPTSTFTLNYVGWATSVNKSNGQAFADNLLPRFDKTADGIKNSAASGFGGGSYMYTVVAAIHETVVGCNVTFTTCTFQVTGGSYDIYYNDGTFAQANAVDGGAWVNFDKGINILSGNFFTSSNTDTFNNQGISSVSLHGNVTFTNAAYVNPKMLNTVVSSTLQLGSSQTGFIAPTSVDGAAITGVVLQADANQNFNNIPEPASLALVGLALGGVGFVARRRK